MPGLGEIAQVLEVDQKSPRVVAGEKGIAEVVFVRDLAAKRDLREMAQKAASSGQHWLKKDQKARLMWATPQLVDQGEEVLTLFPTSQDTEPRDALFPYLVYGAWPPMSLEAQQLTDAVAVAAMAASQRNQRRAVVVILGPPERDGSRLAPEQVRHYLQSLRVPLEVWTTAPGDWRLVPDHGWGELEDVSSFYKLGKAVRQLRRDLERQRIVWLDGVHLPQSIRQVGDARFRLLE